MNLPDGCSWLELPSSPGTGGVGSIAALEGCIPFNVRRVYHLYGVPVGASRGGHAHRELRQVLIPITGSFDVILDDGNDSFRVKLKRSSLGLLIGKMIWRELESFSEGSVCMVAASAAFRESDYYRDHSEFLLAAKV